MAKTPTDRSNKPPHADVRKGQGSTQIDKAAFTERFHKRFYDPAFDAAQPEIARLTEIAWDGYTRYRKAPRTRKAGAGYADPDYELSEDWIAARAAIDAAAARQRDPNSPLRILGICGSPRTDQTCPGEMSKTFRLLQIAREIVVGGGSEFDQLDLSNLTSEYGRVIYPCKACVSTACRSATGPVPAIPTTRWGRSATG